MRYVIEAGRWYEGQLTQWTTIEERFDTYEEAEKEVKPLLLRQQDRGVYMIKNKLYDVFYIYPVEQ